jgi:hypothetical protein
MMDAEPEFGTLSPTSEDDATADNVVVNSADDEYVKVAVMNRKKRVHFHYWHRRAVTINRLEHCPLYRYRFDMRIPCRQ